MNVSHVEFITSPPSAEQIAAPAFEALDRRQARRILARVVNLVNAGRIDAAQTLVSDEITVAALQTEIARHIGACITCAVPTLYGPIDCLERERLERRETRLLVLLSVAGGLN